VQSFQALKFKDIREENCISFEEEITTGLVDTTGTSKYASFIEVLR